MQTNLSPEIAALFANAPDRFLAKIRQDGDCVRWTAGKYPKGYGAFKPKSAKNTGQAHRWAYQWHYGSIPEGAILMHSCDQPDCVNPLHLTPGTRADNNRDMWAKRRHQHGSRHYFAKLDEAKVLEARARYAAGEKLEPLAAEYQVSPPTLWYAIRGRTWSHVK